MIRIASLVVLIAWFSGCGHRNKESALNFVESVESREVIHDGERWVEITITQKLNPNAPAYVTGIRASKSTNRLRWALIEQNLDTSKVISIFRFRPVDEFTELRLDRDDFEWYPQISGFQPVTVALKNPERAANGVAHFRATAK
jgi:hypothetical protein